MYGKCEEKKTWQKMSRESWKWRLTREKFVWKWKFNIVFLFVTNLMSNIKGGADRLTPIKIFYLKLTQIILKKLKPLLYWKKGFLIEDGCSLTWRSPQQLRIILFKIKFNILKTLFASTLIQTNVLQIVQKKRKIK